MNEASAGALGYKDLPGRVYLSAGSLAGLAAGLLNIVIYLALIAIAGHAWSLLIVGSILVASLLPNLLAALAFWVLSRLTRLARSIMTIGIVAFVLISVLPHLGIGPAPSPALSALPEGFDLLTVPLHLVFSLTAIFLMPWLVARSQEKGS